MPYRHELEAQVIDTELHVGIRRRVMKLPTHVRPITVYPLPAEAAGLHLTVPVQMRLGVIPGSILENTMLFPPLHLRAERWSVPQWVPVQRYDDEKTEYGYYLPLDGYAMVPQGIRVTVGETELEKLLEETRHQLGKTQGELAHLKRSLRTVRQASE
jgi:hypothetical protein